MKTVVLVREYTPSDVESMRQIWNCVVEDGHAFVQEETLTAKEAEAFFAGQTVCAVAEDSSGEVCGLYILHPNNVGRCGHIANASYAVASCRRGEGIGRALVTDCLDRAKKYGFRILQFNAVVETNTAARRLYEQLGFVPLSKIEGGFRNPDGSYSAIYPYYRAL